MKSSGLPLKNNKIKSVTPVRNTNQYRNLKLDIISDKFDFL